MKKFVREFVESFGRNTLLPYHVLCLFGEVEHEARCSLLDLDIPKEVAYTGTLLLGRHDTVVEEDPSSYLIESLYLSARSSKTVKCINHLFNGYIEVDTRMIVGVISIRLFTHCEYEPELEGSISLSISLGKSLKSPVDFTGIVCHTVLDSL